MKKKTLFIKWNNSQLLSYTYFTQLPVWILKTEIENLTGIDFTHQHLVCHGKVLQNHDRLTPALAQSTIHVSHRLYGGDIFSDIVDGFNKIGDDITGGIMDAVNMLSVVIDWVEKIWEKIVYFFDCIKCGISKLENLYYCILFYLMFMGFYIYIIFLYVIAYIVDECVGKPVLTPILNHIKKFFIDFFAFIKKNFPMLEPGLNTITDCFAC